MPHNDWSFNYEIDEELKKGVTISREDLLQDILREKKLFERVPDPGFELEKLHPSIIRCLEYLRKTFKERGYEPIPFHDLKSHMYICRNEYGNNYGQFFITNNLRKLWRAGYLRRFVKKKSFYRNKPHMAGRLGSSTGGDWTGIHYTLYPREDFEEIIEL